jgi:hypothetical protein
MHNAWIFPPNFFIEYFSLQTSAKIFQIIETGFTLNGIAYQLILTLSGDIYELFNTAPQYLASAVSMKGCSI